MKWYGTIGFEVTEETKPGVWTPAKTEKKYYGNLERIMTFSQTANQVNDNININNTLSIVADPYANDYYFAMKYAVVRGTKWKITNVEVKYPRLILTLGGVYNG